MQGGLMCSLKFFRWAPKKITHPHPLAEKISVKTQKHRKKNFFQKNQKKFKKPLDKPLFVCYNVDSQGREQNRPTQNRKRKEDKKMTNYYASQNQEKATEQEMEGDRQ